MSTSTPKRAKVTDAMSPLKKPIRFLNEYWGRKGEQNVGQQEADGEVTSGQGVSKRSSLNSDGDDSDTISDEEL